jgi:tripartite-type tricarboxylate transporter receptor subunit TctC
MKFPRAMCTAACLTISLLSSYAVEQSWPSRPITIVSPYPPGGITDLLARIVGDELSKALGQPVIVDDRTGAGGAIALALVAKAAPDGYTLVMGGSAPSVIVPALNPNIAYSPRDFEAIAFVAGLPIVLVANSSVPATNLKEFIAYAKANGGKLNCGHHGAGTGTHLSCVMFSRLIGTTITDVPYKGAPQVNQDLLADRVQFYFGTLPTELGLVKAGQFRAYGVASPERVPSLPDVPTFSEQGLAALNLDTWNALYAPAGTPKAIINRLNAEIVKILQMPEVRRKIEATGSVVRPGSAEQLQKRTADEFATYRKIALEANIKID